MIMMNKTRFHNNHTHILIAAVATIKALPNPVVDLFLILISTQL